MVQAQAGVQQTGGQRRLLGLLAPVFALQIGKHAAHFPAGQHVLDLEALAAAGRAGQTGDAVRRPLHDAVEPVRRVALHDERAVRTARRAVIHGQPLPVLDPPAGQVFQRQRVQHKVAPFERIAPEQAGKPPAARKPRKILLHIALSGHEQLHCQRSARRFARHIILQVGDQLFILAVKHSCVSQYHAVLLKRIQPAPRKQLQHRDIGPLRALQAQRDGLLGLAQLTALLRRQLLLQTALRGLGELVLKFLARHDQTEHIFHLARGAEPLMVGIKIVQPQIEPDKQVAHERPLAVIARAGRQIDRTDILRLHRVASFTVSGWSEPASWSPGSRRRRNTSACLCY